MVFDYGGVLTDGVDGAGEPPLLDVLRQARAAGLRTALLSNADGVWELPDRAEFDTEALFDTVVISGAVGLRKPDPRIFTLTAERLGISAGECVFVDDLAVNVRGAVAAGMIGVHHTSVEATLLELTALFEVAFSAE